MKAQEPRAFLFISIMWKVGGGGGEGKRNEKAKMHFCSGWKRVSSEWQQNNSISAFRPPFFSNTVPPSLPFLSSSSPAPLLPMLSQLIQLSPLKTHKEDREGGTKSSLSVRPSIFPLPPPHTYTHTPTHTTHTHTFPRQVLRGRGGVRCKLTSQREDQKRGTVSPR